MSAPAEMVAGDTRTLTVTVLDQDTGEVVDLTGATIEFGIAASKKDDALITKTTSDGIAVDAPTTGVFVVTLDPEDTADLDPARYWYAGRVTDSTGRKVTVTSGYLTITPSIL